MVEPEVEGIAHAIELALAPVFLMTGVAAMLGVLTTRLSRIIDRARLLERRLAEAPISSRADLHGDIRVLARRARLMNWAISLCTACALLLCTVVASLFLAAFFDLDVSLLVGLFFIAAMLALFAGLVAFLREIYLGTQNLRIGPH
jgi:hypothetical protein